MRTLRVGTLASVSPEQAITEDVYSNLAQKVLLQASRVHNRPVLDLGSPDGFLALTLAEQSPAWTVHASGPVPSSRHGNLEPVDLALPGLPFEPDELGLVTGAFLEGQLEAWGATLAAEIYETLGPEGQVLLLFRGPSPRSDIVPRALPLEAREQLQAAGFEHVEEVRAAELADGTWVYRLEGRVPA